MGTFGDIGTSGDMRTEIFLFCSRINNAWAFKMTSKIKKFFKFIWSLYEVTIDSNELKYQKYQNEKLKKVDLGNLILKYDVIHDALIEICKILKHLRNFGKIGVFGDISIMMPECLKKNYLKK